MESPVRPIIPAISLVLPCVGCVSAPPEPVISEVTTKASPDNPACHGYSAQAVIDGKLQPIVGRACQQPDGTWTIVERSPGKPNQYTTVYVPPPYAITPMSIHGFGPHRSGSALARSSSWITTIISMTVTASHTSGICIALRDATALGVPVAVGGLAEDPPQWAEGPQRASEARGNL
jgi:hypothetical protein